ncbi:hypothetical protein LB823_18195 [Tsukamurella sp. M9C]|uniref:hypothetical protein n=1 Tax=unclassified Tsukamurella TaxID=2633480 RepID=UPI001CC9D417|nr:hypothetical protein [Tsukamurella sp. M9C]MCA0158131.1 hypothetical protein [Tsukamurella sp. M9C]
MNGSAGNDHITWLEAAERSIAEFALATAIADEIAELDAAESAAYEASSMSDEVLETSPCRINTAARVRPTGAAVRSTLRPGERPVGRRRRTAADPVAARSP